MKTYGVCPDCNGPIFPISGTDDFICPCELMRSSNDNTRVYINHCWNCKAPINSDTCMLSLNPGMGYICNECGKDLTEWKGSN